MNDPDAMTTTPTTTTTAPFAGSDLAARQRELVFYTWSAQHEGKPLEIVDGQGARFTTADGHRWWDLGSMTWNANLGHGHPGMKAALAAAAARGLLAHPTSVFPDKARAGELLAEVTPAGLTKSFICLSGAEANENAIKIARLYTGRHKVVARTRSYHGATLGMLSLSGDPRREPFEPGLPGVVRTIDPYCYRCPVGRAPSTCAHECADDLEEVLLREDPGTVAAVIMEGVVGANGVFVPPPGYWRKVREICTRYDVLLVADEVLSGFGRTGRWFAVDHDEVAPDLLTMAKGMTGGYAPGGAVIVSDRIARHFNHHVLQCGLTAYAHPLTCAAIVAAIEAYLHEGLVERAATLGAWLGPRLRELGRARPSVGDVRGIGLLWAIELVRPGGHEPLDPATLARVGAAIRRRHLHLHRRDNMVFVAPPLCASEADLEPALALLGEALDEAVGAAGGRAAPEAGP